MTEAKKIHEYIHQFDKRVAFGAEGTVLEKNKSGLVLKKMGESYSIFLPKNFELENFWDSPEEKLHELFISVILSGIPNANDYCLFPLAYFLDKEKKEVNLLMQKAEGTIVDQCKVLQQDPLKHIRHLLSGFLFLLENGLLQHDNAASNILFDPSKKLFKFADFGETYLLEALVQDENQNKSVQLVREAYGYLIGSVTFSLAGGSNLQTNENPDYLTYKETICLLVEERTDWENQSFLSVKEACMALTRRIRHFDSKLNKAML